MNNNNKQIRSNMDCEDMSNKDFRGMNFQSASMVGACLDDSLFDIANMDDVQAYEADAFNATFLGASMLRSRWTWSDCPRATFIAAILRDADFQCASLTACDFIRADLANVNFFRADLQNADFYEANLVGASFWGANLAGANFRGAVGLTYKEGEMEAAKYLLDIFDNHPDYANRSENTPRIAQFAPQWLREREAGGTPKIYPTIAQYCCDNHTDEDFLVALDQIARGNESLF